MFLLPPMFLFVRGKLTIFVFIYITFVRVIQVSLRASSPGDLAAGREKKGELATTSLEFEFRLQVSCGSPLSELSDFGQSAQTRNQLQCNKHVKHVKEGQISRVMQI